MPLAQSYDGWKHNKTSVSDRKKQNMDYRQKSADKPMYNRIIKKQEQCE